MKQKNFTHLLLRPRIILLAVIFYLPQMKVMAADHKAALSFSQKNFDDGKKPAKREKSFRSQNVVKVFPDVIKRSMHVVARSGNEKEIDFLVFDLNGNMVLNYKLKAGERRTISNLKKGAYMYHVFAESEYLTTGKIEFR